MDSATRISLLAVVVAIATAFYAIQEARKANRLTVLAGFIKEYRDLEPQRRYVLTELAEYAGLRISALPNGAREKVNAVAYYLDGLGLLVEKGLIHQSDIVQLLGGSIQRQYEALRPFIEQERDSRGEPIFMRGFEHLAALAQDQEAVRRSDAPLEYAHLRRFQIKP